MKKLLIVGAFATAVGAAGYVALGSGDSPLKDYDWNPLKNSDWNLFKKTNLASELLEGVPADTLLYSGSLEPMPVDKTYEYSRVYGLIDLPDEVKDELGRGKKGRFFTSVIESLLGSVDSLETYQATFGVSNEVVSAMYMVGAMPVIKFNSNNPQAIWQLLDEAEQESGFAHEEKQIADQSYRSYELAQDEQLPLSLIVAQRDGWVTLALSVGPQGLNENAIKLALGLNKPEQSLQSTGKLQAIRDEFDFLPQSLAYIDHQEIITGLTTEDGNSFAKMLSSFFELTGERPPRELRKIRSAECQKDLSAIAANWPKTLIGLHDLQADNGGVSFKHSTIIESKNTAVMGALTSLQGFVPAYVEGTAFGMGIGVDMNNLVPALGKIHSDILSVNYNCPSLVEMQNELKAANPAALAMATGMAQGVKGISFGLYDFAVDTATAAPSVSSLDAIVTLSADDPTVLFNMAKGFVPSLASIELAADGTPVDISGAAPLPSEVQVKPMLALNGSHLSIFTGNKSQAAAKALADEKLQNNGLMAVALDYSVIMNKIGPIIEAEKDLKEVFKLYQGFSGKEQYRIKFSQQGVVLSGESNYKFTK